MKSYKHGIQANATRRVARSPTRRQIKQAVLHATKDRRSVVVEVQKQQIKDAIRQRRPPFDPPFLKKKHRIKSCFRAARKVVGAELA